MNRIEDVVETMKNERLTGDGRRGLTIVLTGANSGIGLAAAKIMIQLNPLHRLILVARSLEKATYAQKEVLSVLPIGVAEQHKEHIIPLVCDHCSFDSVRTFAVNLQNKLDETYTIEKWAFNGIDVLCLNAAVLMPNDSDAQFTMDGIETMFQTNHLSPFLIANLLLDMMNPGGRVVISTSGLHLQHKLCLDGMMDPVTGLARKGFEMINGEPFHFKTSYSLSKLCNVALCLDLHQRLTGRGCVANCFSPGLMTTSGLFRYQPNQGKDASRLHSLKKQCYEKTVAWGAGALVYMALTEDAGQRGGEYWSDPNSPAASHAIYGQEFAPVPITSSIVQAQSERQQLWRLSCQLVGIKSDV